MDYICGLLIINICSPDVPWCSQTFPLTVKVGTLLEKLFPSLSLYRIDLGSFYRLNCSHHFSNFSIFKTSKLKFWRLIIWGGSFNLIDMTIRDVHIIKGKINLNKLPNFLKKVCPTIVQRGYFLFNIHYLKMNNQIHFFKILYTSHYFISAIWPLTNGNNIPKNVPTKNDFCSQLQLKGEQKIMSKSDLLMTLKKCSHFVPLSYSMGTNFLTKGNNSTKGKFIWGVTKKSQNKFHYLRTWYT